ncbi:MAG: Bro-N domain-containing protein, partial [Candidatus Fonsibacter sp.]
MIFINKPSLYSLILRSGKQEAKAFKKWVCSDVLPSIRKHGVYAMPTAAIQIIRNPTGETKLHYNVKKHIEKTYPYVIIVAVRLEPDDRL